MPIDPRHLPTLLIGIDVLCAIGYACDGGLDAWRKIVYWLAAATLTCTVTW